MKRWLALATVLALSPPVTAAPPTLTVAVGGDVMFGRVTADGWRAHGGSDPFGAWRDTLRDADVAFVNLETGICASGRTKSALPLLWAPPDRLDALRDAGIDVVSIANNHALDCGPGGVRATTAALARRSIAAAGVAPDGAVQVSGDVVVLAATLYPPPFRSDGHDVLYVSDAGALIPRVEDLRRKHPDTLILVSLHWGRERSNEVAAWQRELAHYLVDAGADAIIGHGPHTPQPREIYRGAPILFSLGNLVFDDNSAVGHPRAPVLLRFARQSHRWRLVDPDTTP